MCLRSRSSPQSDSDDSVGFESQLGWRAVRVQLVPIGAADEVDLEAAGCEPIERRVAEDGGEWRVTREHHLLAIVKTGQAEDEAKVVVWSKRRSIGAEGSGRAEGRRMSDGGKILSDGEGW